MLNIDQNRILLIDDNESIHKDFRKVLDPKPENASLDAVKALVFGTTDPQEAPETEKPVLSIDSAFQGQEGLELVKKSMAEGRPYSLAFVDVRMPPGWDGIVTIQKIWEVDDSIQIVICTAHSDYSWEETSQILKNNDNFLILKKPFDSIEIRQMVAALTIKWLQKKQVQYQIENLERLVSERTLDLKKSNIELAHQATHDILTGLPNRALLTDRIKQAIFTAKRNGLHVAVLFLDLDNFKQVNDSLGHSAGDTLLATVSKKLSAFLRESDTVARLGGDEFIIVLNNYPKEKDSLFKVTQLIESFNQPIDVVGNNVVVTATVGVSFYPQDGEDAETLLKNADAALYHAKEMGKNTFQIYHKEFNQHLLERAHLTSALRVALENNQFILNYQPLVELSTGKIIGTEALIRWNHPSMGLIPPNTFISLAEQTGLIASIGEWVLRTACIQNKIWHQTIPDLRISVNVSVYQFQQHNFVEIVRKVLAETEMDPKYLELEITESLILSNVADATQKMIELKELGVHFSMDDFGTGYASLNYLKFFPFDKIKIDKSFIDGIASNNEDSSIVEAIIAMTKTMKMEVLAEGVESKDQLDFLIKHHGNQMQGYYFSRPLDVNACTTLLNENTLKIKN